MQFARQTKKNRNINMTPLIDVVFLLLIFFMLSTSLVNQKAINLFVPSKVGKATSWQGSIIIRPGKTSVLINSLRVDKSKVGKVLADLIKDNKQKIIIKPYKNMPIQTTVEIIDKVRNAGASLITLVR